MSIFEFEAYDKNGSIIREQVEFDSIDLAQQSIADKGYYLISIKKKSDKQIQSLFLSKELSLDDMEFLTSELSLLLSNGVKIDRGLQILGKSKANTRVGQVLDQLSLAVKRGDSLSDALKEHKEFDNLYVNLVRMGEASGQLSEIFKGLARDLKFRKELKSKISQAMAYPLVILVVCVLAIVFVFNFIVPQMSSLFDENDQLPIYTSVLLNVSDWMISYQWYLFAAIICGVFAGKFLLAKGTFSTWLDDVAIKTPVIRNAVVQIERIRFNTSMALMLSSGVKLDEALGMASSTVKNGLLRRELIAAKNKIKSGTSITEALKSNLMYSGLFISLIEVGEESGQLSVVFEEIADRSRSGFTSWTTRFTSVLEPIMILFMAGIVGSVVVVMLLSIISVNDSI
jgi:general secretion pathway protein F